MKDNEIEDVNGDPHGTSLDEIIDGLTNRRLDEEQYIFFPSEIWKEQEVILQSCRAGNNASNMFDFIDSSLWSNKEFVSNFLITAERYCQSDDVEGIRIKDHIHKSLIEDKEIKPLLDSYIDNLDVN